MLRSPEDLDLCWWTIQQYVNVGLSVMRASHFNRDPNTEHQIKVIEARMKIIEAVVEGEKVRLAVAARAAEERTHGPESAIDDPMPQHGPEGVYSGDRHG